jgi:ACS family tartrate transporter-like MFS transporter
VGVSPGADEARVLRKAAWRLVPFLGLLYFTAYLDRVNVSFAALTMNADVGLSASAYGLGAGIFFIGYFLFEAPSNLILEKVGARRWIARIMVTWGLLSAAMALVQGPASFYAVRFLLGLAEAGFFPGIILYLTYWFPWAERSRIVAAFMTAIPLSSVIGAPVSTSLLGVSVFGLKGWQTMFLLEGLPAVVLGVVVWFVLADRPAEAKWLTPDERTVLKRALDRDHGPQPDHVHGLAAALARPAVWGFALVYFGLVMGNYGLTAWLPQIVKGFGGLSNVQTGWLSALPYLLGAASMVFWARHSDRTGERTWHFAGPAAIAAAGFLAAALARAPAWQFAGLTLATVAINCAVPVFWSFPTRFLRATAAAGGIALINAIGNLAGFVGPSVMGVMKEATGAYGGGLMVLSASLAFAAVLAWALGRRRAPAPA